MLQREQVEKIVDEAVQQTREFFIAQQWVRPNWTVKVTKSYSPSRRRSWGGTRRGTPFISLALHYYLMGVCDFREYKSFAADPEIGSVKGDVVKAIRALVVHEMCHAVQFSYKFGIKSESLACHVNDVQDTSGHDALWKNIYRISRRALVNNIKQEVPTAQPAAEQVQRSMKRAEALVWIREAKSRGQTTRQIVDTLVTQYGFKKATATTYTYVAFK